MFLGDFGSCEAVAAQGRSLSCDGLKLEHELYEAGIVHKFFFSVMSHTVLCPAKVLRAFEL